MYFWCWHCLPLWMSLYVIYCVQATASTAWTGTRTRCGPQWHFPVSGLAKDQWQADRDRDRDRQRHSDRQKETKKGRGMQRQTETETVTDRETQTDRGRQRKGERGRQTADKQQRQTETDGVRQRQQTRTNGSVHWLARPSPVNARTGVTFLVRDVTQWLKF
jgi:hypothetical protein